MNYSDIKTKLDWECDSNDTSFIPAMKLIEINNALEEVVAEIIEVNGDFQFDDSNFTDLPEGTADLVNGQKDYSFDTTFLDILGVSVKDANGVYQALIPIDQRDMTQNTGNVSGQRMMSGSQKVDPSNFYPTAGMPIYYDKKGGSVYLYPTPATGSVTLTAGLKVYFQRTAHLFELADTTAVPGFMSTFHKILPLMASIGYNKKYHPDRVQATMAQIQEIKTDLRSKYSKRAKDEVRRLQVKQESTR